MYSGKIIIDIGHPAQVHQFKNIYWELKEKGYEILFTAKRKEITQYLLRQYNLQFESMGQPRKGLVKKILYIHTSCFRFYKIVKQFKPNLVLSRFSFHATWVSSLLKIPHIGFTDTEHVILADKLTVPFVNTKLTAYSYQKDLGKNHIRYSGNIEMFYLHPKRFKPDKTILKHLGVNDGEKYIIMRFIAWDAHHDIGQNGLTVDMKIKAVKQMAKLAKIFITSEKDIPSELEQYRINVPPEKIHDALYFSSMYFGEGATMASESALLGVPAVYINSLTAGSIEELQENKLLYRFMDGKEAIGKAIELLKQDKEVNKLNLKKFLNDKIDVTAFIVWFIQNYPESRDLLKSNPSYQEKF